jgi:signal peptidase I
MIYRNSYFKKEARQAYIDNHIGLRRQIFLALFVGLISFSAFFVLQTLKESVLSDAVPEIMQPSFFSTIYIYIHAAVICAAVYFIAYYDYLFFSEIRRNAWYLLIQMRYHPAVMIAGKIAALFYSMCMFYTAGFAFTVLLTVFLKYTFVFAYMPALYIAGLADIFILTSLSALISLYVKRMEDARLLIAAAAVFIFVFKAFTGAYGILGNRVLMQNLNNLADTSKSWFFPAAAVILVLCVAVCVLRARQMAQYYSIFGKDEELLPADVSLVYIDSITGRQELPKKNTRHDKQRKWINTAITILLIVFIFAALTLNILIILIGTATPGNEVTIRGLIPYVFRSDTMQPSIAQNDLVFFRKVDSQYPVEKGQIVLFRDNNIVYVERITKKLDDTLEVDIDHYPAGAESGAMIKSVHRAAVYGIYSTRSRWLGALILFANTIIGRVLFLLVPAIFLFFRKQIAAAYKKSRGT